MATFASSSGETTTGTDGAADSKAVRALTLFEALRTSLDAAQLPPSKGSPASTVPAAARTAAPSAPKRTARKVLTVAQGGAKAGEDAQRQLLQRQLTHAEELVKRLHDKNAALRDRVRQLQSTEATLRRDFAEAKAAAHTINSVHTQDVDPRHGTEAQRIAELEAQVAELTSRMQAPMPPPTPTPAPTHSSTSAVQAKAALSLQVAALQSEVQALTHRLEVCEGQRDALAEVQLASLLSPSATVPSSAEDGEARVARLVNAEVRKLFLALRQQLLTEATLREAERARRSELLYLLERSESAHADV